ncbi:LysR substrate-binding domain-containing protein [Thauera sp. Sel9]|uniref:LysR substrate-binding domain-containing protein n=1 Tax=Thauera sp. Sel9 TaxID=2974299 RepID=UPI0021E12B0B|nr:LysR substrate-binding domain-containing protein [Thauera sp. Sel9]MCV2216000.1 LysR substrate-binding domain-containing protein [Thauera sp. Sel9]
MDLRHLRYFIAVAEEQNIGRAATRLHISQPPLTRQIQQLEEELGVRLLNRTPRGVELTQAGALFLDEARNIRAVVEQATERTQRAGQGKLGRLDVGIFGTAILDAIPKLLLAFRRSYPEVKIVLHTMNKGEQIEALRQRRITVGFNRMLAPLPDITTRLVANERLLLAMSHTSPLAAQESVPFPALRDHPLVLFPTGARPNFIDKVMTLCHEAGFEPLVSQEVSDAITGVALAAGGFGVCLVPESTTSLALPGVIYKPLTGLPDHAQVDLSCIYRSDDQSPILEAFLGTIEQMRSTLQSGAALTE